MTAPSPLGEFYLSTCILWPPHELRSPGGEPCEPAAKLNGDVQSAPAHASGADAGARLAAAPPVL
ncbi:MAG TPA: hypothetical protein VFB32_13935 [Rudaea sp.]|nr:hypothetical protein [Rudaea sp.]